MTRPLLSVIIPAYGRWQELPPLLDSVIAQDFDDWECVIAEDGSPNQDKIQQIAAAYAERTNGRVRYYGNKKTLGYDGNFRHLVDLARGEFLFIMGDDDLVAPGAFRAVERTIRKCPNLGVILRVFAKFHGTPDHIGQVSRYYPEECTFPAGPGAIVACFRRLVVMSGLVFHRDLAQAAATDRWDGSLFYQHWLAANILLNRDAVYIPDILAYYRMGRIPSFGAAEKERELYRPGVYPPPETELRMVGSVLAIAQAMDDEHGLDIAPLVRRDLANYMYPTFAHQGHLAWPAFYKLYRDLGRIGFDRYAAFHAWFWVAAVLGTRNVDRIIEVVRHVLGHTPNLSRFVRPIARRQQV